jgi:pimeloyl-ACP methyl ester carboxylesterase
MAWPQAASVAPVNTTPALVAPEVTGRRRGFEGVCTPDVCTLRSPRMFPEAHDTGSPPDPGDQPDPGDEEGAVSRDTSSEQQFIRAQERTLRHHGVVAESRFIDVDAVAGRAHVLVAGDGPPVMMVIGGGLPAAMWAPLMAELEGFTLHAVDLPGLGLTDTATYSSATFRSFSVDFLDQVLTGLGLDQPVLVGQSIGGQWSTWTALDRPDQVPALVLMGCRAAMLGTAAPLPLRLLSVPGLGRLMTRLLPPSPTQIDRLARTAGEDLSDHPELRSLLLAAQRLPTWNSALLDMVSSVVSLRGARPQVTLSPDECARISQPVQLVWGEDDTFGPPAVGERAADLIPDAELHVVPGGHGPWFRYAEHIGDRLTPFLRKHAVTPHPDRT